MNKVPLSILVVDDDHITRFIHQQLIESLNRFTIKHHEAVNGLDAIRLLRELILSGKPLPDLILLDIDMPLLDGFGFIEAFRKSQFDETNKVEIILVSSSSNPRDTKRSCELGVNVIAKPISAEQLTSAILRHSPMAA